MKGKSDRRSENRAVSTERRKRATDRRRAPRIVIDVPADYGTGDVLLYSYVTDVSAFGLFVRANSPYPVGTRLTIRFAAQGAKPAFEVQGEVRWVNSCGSSEAAAMEPGMGMELIDASPELRQALVEAFGTEVRLESSKP